MYGALVGVETRTGVKGGGDAIPYGEGCRLVGGFHVVYGTCVGLGVLKGVNAFCGLKYGAFGAGDAFVLTIGMGVCVYELKGVSGFGASVFDGV